MRVESNPPQGGEAPPQGGGTPPPSGEGRYRKVGKQILVWLTLQGLKALIRHVIEKL
ncbi:autotransporter secretion inner membrane protein TamB [Streptomyces hygroscopicus]|nr:autotransporter secretion inner membrane protein TamB [Streptomyces hygroscopicus]